MAHAVTDWEHDGLYWRVQSGKEVAVVTVNGPANNATTHQLESTCRILMDIGKRIDIDARGVTYVDSFLLSALFRLNTLHANHSQLSRYSTPHLHVTAGETLRDALRRENMIDSFCILDAPEMPKDASDMASFALGMRSIHRSGLVTQAVHAERATGFSVVSSVLMPER